MSRTLGFPSKASEVLLEMSRVTLAPRAWRVVGGILVAVLAFADPLRAETRLNWEYFSPVPAEHQFITGLTEAKGKLLLVTRTEVWEAEIQSPAGFSKVFDPTFAGVRMHQGSLTFYDPVEDLYYFSGGLFDQRIYAYDRNIQSLVAQGALLDLDDSPRGLVVDGGLLYATSAEAVNVYPADPVQDVLPVARFGVGLLEDARGVALDQGASSLFVLDASRQQIFQFALEADPVQAITPGDVRDSFFLVRGGSAGTLLQGGGRIFTFDLSGDGTVYDAQTGVELAVFSFDAAGLPPNGFGGKLAATVSSDGNTLYVWDYGAVVKSYDLSALDGPGPIFNTYETPILSAPFSSTAIVTIQGAGGSLTLAPGASAGETLNLNPGVELVVSRDSSLTTSVLRLLSHTTPSRVTVQGDAGSRGLLAVKSVLSFGGDPAGHLALDGGILQAAGNANVAVPLQFQAGGGWLDSRGHELRIDGLISGEGEVTKIGAGTVILNGPNTATGDIWVQAGVLQFAGFASRGGGALHVASGAGVVYQVGGAGEFTEEDVQALFASGPEWEAGARIGVDIHNSPGGNSTFTANLTETGAVLGFFKRGAGMLTLAGTNTYRGGTGVEEGVLHFAFRNSLPDNQLTVAGGGEAVFSVGGLGEFGQADIEALAVGTAGTGFLKGAWMGLDTSHAAGGRFVLSSNLADPNGGANVLGLVKRGEGKLVLEGANSYSGGTRILQGLVEFSGGENLGSGKVTLDGGGLRWAAGNTEDISSRLNALGSAGATFDTNGHDIILAADLSGPGSLIKTGGGVLTLLGNNSFSAAIVTDGWLAFSGRESLGSGGILVANAGLRWLDHAAIPALHTSGTVTFDTNGYDGVLEEFVLGSSGTFLKTGAGQLAMPTSTQDSHALFWEEVIVEGGTLRVGSLNAGAVTVRAGATLAQDWGMINGTTTVQSGGHLAADRGAWGVNFQNGLVLEDGAILDLLLTVPESFLALIRVSGGVLAGAPESRITLNLTAGPDFEAGTFAFLDFSGAGLAHLNADSFVFGSVIDGYTVDVVQEGTTFLIVVVPEPSAGVCVVLSAAIFVLRRGRRIPPPWGPAKPNRRAA